MSEGWIKIHRNIQDKGWANRPEYIALWVHILLLANHVDSEYFWNGRTIILKAGELITGRKYLSEKTGIHQSSVERILKTFEIEQQIEQRKTSTSRLISINNWDKWQKVEQRFEQRMNNERTTAEQRLNTKEELKNYNNEKNERINKEKALIFIKPELFEVENFFSENGSNFENAETFFNHFESNGWLVGGKSKMKNWQAAAKNWISRSKSFNNHQNTTKNNGNKPATFDQIQEWASQPISTITLGDFSSLRKPKNQGND